jgi:hypothetical protein
MSKHTPTPWFAYQSLSENTWTVQYSGGWIARVLDVEPHRHGQANAEFIVRACNSHEDLLEALKLAHDHLAVTHIDIDGSKTKELLQIEAALDRAEGK